MRIFYTAANSNELKHRETRMSLRNTLFVLNISHRKMPTIGFLVYKIKLCKTKKIA